MAAPATADDFLSLLDKSALLEQEQLQEYLDGLNRDGSLPAEPSALAALLVRDGLLTHFQADQLLRGKHRGFVLGGYRILERLGSGGMATVFLCEHLRMRRLVALKVLPPSRADDPVCLGRFLREAQAVARLDHPNIVRAHDVGQDGPTHFLVMEYVDGADLQALVSCRGRLNVARAAAYVRQAARGLDHAHRAGLIHRDIKPGNLLLDRRGVIKILDMGLARFFQDDGLTREYENNAILGTADYVSPEQVRDSHNVDARTDLYSLGATFYFLLAGRTPFAEGKLRQKLIWHQMREPMPVNSVAPEVPAALAAVVARMMAKDVGKRYQTAAEVIEALAPWTGTPVPPPASGELPSPRLAARVARMTGAGGGSTAAAALSGTDLELKSLPPPLPEPTRVVAVAPLPGPVADVCLQPAPPPISDRVAATREALQTRPAIPDTGWADLLDDAPPEEPPPRRPRALRRWVLLAVLPAIALLVGVVWWGVAANSPRPAASPPPAVPVPRDLRAAILDEGGVELRWEAPPEAPGFKVERAADPDFRQGLTLLATTDAGVSRYIDPDPPGRPQYYRVRTVGAAGDSATSNAAAPPPNYPRRFRDGCLVLNGGATLANGTLRLTDARQRQTRSAFYPLRVSVRSFTTTFRFRIGAGNNIADGFTFCLQGAGPTQVGADGGGLGYAGIPRSVAVKFDVWDNDGEGRNSTGVFTGGQQPSHPGSVDLTPAGIDLHSGRTYDATVTYQYHEKKLTLRVTDVAAPVHSFEKTFTVNIPAEVGGPTAFVGFTGGTGGVGVVQEILSWTWTPGKGS